MLENITQFNTEIDKIPLPKIIIDPYFESKQFPYKLEVNHTLLAEFMQLAQIQDEEIPLHTIHFSDKQKTSPNHQTYSAGDYDPNTKTVHVYLKTLNESYEKNELESLEDILVNLGLEEKKSDFRILIANLKAFSVEDIDSFKSNISYVNTVDTVAKKKLAKYISNTEITISRKLAFLNRFMVQIKKNRLKRSVDQVAAHEFKHVEQFSTERFDHTKQNNIQKNHLTADIINGIGFPLLLLIPALYELIIALQQLPKDVTKSTFSASIALLFTLSSAFAMHLSEKKTAVQKFYADKKINKLEAEADDHEEEIKELFKRNKLPHLFDAIKLTPKTQPYQ